MKTIFFSDSAFIPSSENEDVVSFSPQSFSEALDFIEKELPDSIIVYAEMNLGGSGRTESKGIELVKHIRLTPLNNNLQNIPITLIHWLPIERYIETDLENILLFSPGIKRISLPYRDISSNQNALSEKITSFLFNSLHDEEISEHTFRNEIAINQFEADIKSGNHDFKSKPIWYKKLFYKQGYTIETPLEDQTQIQQSLKILLIDDMGDKWKPALLKVLPKSEIIICKSVSDAQSKIKELNDSILFRRNTFNQKVKSLLTTSGEIDDKKEELKSILMALQGAKNALAASRKVLLNETSIVETKNKELHLLLEELTQNNGLLEALIDFKTENINAESKLKANKLSSLITSISNSKEEISNSKKTIAVNELKISEGEMKKSKLDLEINTLISNQKTITNEAGVLFESLFISEYDLALLDMHLSKDSENKCTNEMDGFQVLEAMHNSNLKIPTAIFSATTKQLDQLKDKFRFLQRKQFLKGITPPKDLSLIIGDLNTNSVVNRLINTIDEVIVFSQLKYREYEAYDSSKYITLIANQEVRTNIVGKLNSIKTSLNSYSLNRGINNLQNIVLILGNILRENRLTVRRSVQDRQNSLFHKTNADKNGISSQCADLIYWRNKTEHSPSNAQEKAQYEEWCNRLDLSEIEKHLKTVYRGLVFDE